ncbi:Pepco domain-containing protein [Streptomyces hydrogenans]|uniref:Pepco domain-containing protein n=1 Tax=Streptomyces hydrogenans TaxID=1873719 RepID=UPI0035E1E109
MTEKVNDAVDGTTLPFWVEVEETDEDDAMGGLFRRGGGDADAVLRPVPLGPLRKNLAETVDALQKVFADVAAREGTLPLAEAQITFQVTAGGGIQLVGGGQVAGTRGLTLTFKRPA